MKRLLDMLVAASGLTIGLPLFAGIALAVRLTSPGPVLFRQERIGRGFRPFTLYKFRTMVAGTERQRAVTAGGDPRITGLGRWLRRTKLDELPQLVNVLKGDMSLVGPRPEIAKFVAMFEPEYRDILTIRPGLTDFAAVEYRNEEDILAAYSDPEHAYAEIVLPAKITLYRRYLGERGVLTDARILVRTVAAILRPPGAPRGGLQPSETK